MTTRPFVTKNQLLLTYEQELMKFFKIFVERQKVYCIHLKELISYTSFPNSLNHITTNFQNNAYQFSVSYNTYL